MHDVLTLELDSSISQFIFQIYARFKICEWQASAEMTAVQASLCMALRDFVFSAEIWTVVDEFVLCKNGSDASISQRVVPS